MYDRRCSPTDPTPRYLIPLVKTSGFEMGGRGSGRWRYHIKRALVEDSLSVDVVALRRAGVLGEQGGSGSFEWRDRATGERLGLVLYHVGPAADDGRELALFVVRPPELLTRLLRLEAFRPQFGGLRWFLRCPVEGCPKRALKVFFDGHRGRFGCRSCLGLIHATAQEHDERVDLARRDPQGFLEARSRAPRTLRSRMVTASLIGDALLYPPNRSCSGRGWGRKSLTTWDRVVAELRRDFERRFNRPLFGPTT